VGQIVFILLAGVIQLRSVWWLTWAECTGLGTTCCRSADVETTLQPETKDKIRKARKDLKWFLLTCSCTKTHPDNHNSLMAEFIASMLFMVSITSISRRTHQFNRAHWHFSEHLLQVRSNY